MVKLVIQGIEIPLFDSKVSLTKQINNIAELADRQATFTNKFKAAKTPELVAQFENLGIVGSLSRKPYTVLGAQLTYQGVQVMESGNAYITNDNENYYSIAIYDGNIFFFQAIGNTKLNELDFSDLTHDLNPANYIASFPNTEGYIYAVSDNGQFTPLASPDNIQINYQLPAIFIHTIWEKIFDLTPFGYHGDIFSDPKFLALVMSMKRGYNSELDAVIVPVQLHYTGIDDDIDYLVEEEDDIVGTTHYFWSAVWWTQHLANQGILNSGILNILEDSQYTMSWNLDLTNIPNTSKVSVKISETTSGSVTYIDITNNVSGSFNVTDSVTFTAEAGEHYIFSVGITGESTGQVIPVNVVTNVTGTWDFVDASSTVISISISSFIGDMLVKDFIKDIMQHFGLMMQISDDASAYEFVKMDALLLDTDNAQDLSDNFVRELGASYQLKGYAQKNRFAYNYFNPDRVRFADGFLNVGNENLTPERTHLTRPYNACDTSKTLLNNLRVTSTPFWEAERDDNGVITRYKPISSKNYIAELKRVHESIRYNVTGGAGIYFEGEVPRLDFSNLGYETILDENYRTLETTVLDWNNVKSLEMRFTAKEVKDFNFLNQVYIKHLSSYFYFNSIKYSGDKVSKVEAVKITPSGVIPTLKAESGTDKDIELISASYDTILDAQKSYGDIESYYWELISAPVGGSVVFVDETLIKTKVTFSNHIGEWVFKLTVSNDKTQDESFKIINTV